MKYISLLIAIAFCATACNDWLDVRPDTEQKAEDQFSSVDGFYGALTGCYMSMADQDAYGERLTMSDVETLANLWYIMEDTDDIEAEDLTKHDYTTTDARNAIQAMYAQLYNVIAQASMIIKYAHGRIHEKGDPRRGLRPAGLLPIRRPTPFRANAAERLPASGIALFRDDIHPRDAPLLLLRCLRGEVEI